MDLVGFLRFSLLCLDFLAWPAFALVYPLWASIRAIETSSKHHLKKLVTYWTIFSLISLFEILFVKLIEWVPFWPYVRLVAVCWLVLPRFNGACHVYERLLHPYLSVKPQESINCFSIPKDKPFSEDSFLALAETYLKENGPEGLENLIASKGKHKQILTDAKALEVVKKIEPTKENITAEEQLVEHPKLHLVESEKKEVAAPEAERVTTPTESKVKTPLGIHALKLHLVESEKKEVAAPEAERVTTPTESKEKTPLEIHALKKVQREWTCAVCQLTLQSEATLNSHLLGRKHRSNCEKLKTNTQTTKNMQSSAAKNKSNTEELKTSKQTSNDLKSSATKTNDSNQSKNDLEIFLAGGGSKQNTTEKPISMHTNKANGQQQMQDKPKEMNASVKQQSKLWCSICDITCAREMDMACHLKGRKHLKSSAKQTNSSNITKNGPKICLPGERSEQNTVEQPKTVHIDAASGQLIQQPNLWCSICNIRCTGEIDMACHLNGREHLFNLQMISFVGGGQPSYFTGKLAQL